MNNQAVFFKNRTVNIEIDLPKTEHNSTCSCIYLSKITLKKVLGIEMSEVLS